MHSIPDTCSILSPPQPNKPLLARWAELRGENCNKLTNVSQSKTIKHIQEQDISLLIRVISYFETRDTFPFRYSEFETEFQMPPTLFHLKTYVVGIEESLDERGGETVLHLGDDLGKLDGISQSYDKNT